MSGSSAGTGRRTNGGGWRGTGGGAVTVAGTAGRLRGGGATGGGLTGVSPCKIRRNSSSQLAARDGWTVGRTAGPGGRAPGGGRGGWPGQGGGSSSSKRLFRAFHHSSRR